MSKEMSLGSVAKEVRGVLGNGENEFRQIKPGVMDWQEPELVPTGRKFGKEGLELMEELATGEMVIRLPGQQLDSWLVVSGVHKKRIVGREMWVVWKDKRKALAVRSILPDEGRRYKFVWEPGEGKFGIDRVKKRIYLGEERDEKGLMGVLHEVGHSWAQRLSLDEESLSVREMRGKRDMFYFGLKEEEARKKAREYERIIISERLASLLAWQLEEKISKVGFDCMKDKRVQMRQEVEEWLSGYDLAGSAGFLLQSDPKSFFGAKSFRREGGLEKLWQIDRTMQAVNNDLNWVWEKLRFEDGRRSNKGVREWRWETGRGRLTLTLLFNRGGKHGMVEFRGEEGWYIYWSRWLGVSLIERIGGEWEEVAEAFYSYESLTNEEKLLEKSAEVKRLLQRLVLEA